MAVGYKDYYATLGVGKDASAEDVKQAYRRLARRFHPDLQQEKDKSRAAERFKEINEAYEVLSDPEKRAKYDALGPEWERAGQAPEPGPPPGPREGYGGGGAHEASWEGQGTAGFSEFFESLFGGGVGEGVFRRAGPIRGGPRGGPRRGEDVEAELRLSLEDALRGGDKRLSIVTPAVCPDCGGAGRLGQRICPTCAGLGETRVEKPVTVHLPAGIYDGMRLRLRGQGGRASGDAEPGDLYIRIRLLPHPDYRAMGSDLETTATLMPWDAYLGGEIEVPTPEGRVRMRVPPRTRSGRRFRVAGRGLGKSGGSRGDLFVVARIDNPDRSGERLERLFRELKEAAS